MNKKIGVIIFVLILLVFSVGFVEAATYTSSTGYTSKPVSSRLGYDSQRTYSNWAGENHWNNEINVGSLARSATSGWSSLWKEPSHLGEAIVVNVDYQQPSIVNVALLEQNDVPVDIYLKGSTFGTIISPFTSDVSQEDIITGITSIPPIHSVDLCIWNEDKTSCKSVSSSDNEYVADINYFAPRQYAFSLNNLGYLRVWLKQFEEETVLPEAKAEDYVGEGYKDSPALTKILESNLINLDLHATLHFDLSQSGIFGLSPQTIVLKPEANEDAWLSKINKFENKVYGGKLLVRATAIEKSGAAFVLYSDQQGRFSSIIPGPLQEPYLAEGYIGRGVAAKLDIFKMDEGEVEGPIKVANTGNPLEDYVSLRLDSIITADDRAVFEIQGYGKSETRAVMKGKEVYSNSRWHLESVSKEPLSGGRDRQWLLDNGFSSFTLKGLGATNLNVVKHTARLKSDVGERREIVRYIIEPPSNGWEIPDITPEVAKNLQLKYCPNLGEGSFDFFTGTPISSSGPVGYACTAVAKLDKFIEEHPSSSRIGEAYGSLTRIYGDYLVDYAACDVISGAASSLVLRDLAKCMEFKGDMDSLGYHYAKIVAQKYPELIDHEKEKLLGAGGDFTIPEEYTSMQLKYVVEKNEKSGGAMYRVNKGKNIVDARVGEYLKDPNGLDMKVISGKNEYRYRIQEIAPTYMEVVVWDHNKDTKQGLSKKLALGDISPLLVQQTSTAFGQNPVDAGRSTVDVEVLEINTDYAAVVTIVPGTGHATSESNFSVHIPVEDSSIEFTPDQLQKQIDGTDNIIEKLDSGIEKLEYVVKKWKQFCMMTFAFLTLKNSLFDGGGRVIARKAVSEYYKTDVCSGNIGWNQQYKSVDECLQKNGDAMEKLMDTEEEAVRYASDAVEGQTVESLQNKIGTDKDVKKLVNSGTGADGADFFNSGNNIEDYRNFKRYSKLSDELGSSNDPYLRYLENTQVAGFGTMTTKLNNYAAAKTKYAALDPAIKQAMDESNGGETQSIQTISNALIEEAQKSGVASSEVKQVYGFVAKTGSNDEGYAVDIQSGNGLELIRLPEYAYEIYSVGLEQYKKDIKNAVKKSGDSSAVTAEEVGLYIQTQKAGKYASDQNGNPLFVEKKFLVTSTEVKITNPSGVVEGVKLLQLSGALLNKANAVSLKTFKIYSSREKNAQGKVLRNDYATDKLYAEYGEDGFVYCAPTGENGEYFFIFERFKTGDPNAFEIRNVGANGLMECTGGKDAIVYDRSALALKENQALRLKYKNILNNYNGKCKEDGDLAATVNGKAVYCNSQQRSIANQINQPRCTDVMDPSDCKLLFNACDPVMCPASRCDFGGRYPVDNVIQSGMVGSVMLCLPNKDQGVVMPVCLTGILASLKNIRSVVKDYQQCLQTQLESGKQVGLCNYIQSVGLCQFFWKEAMGIAKMRGGLIDFFSDKISGEERGGGEYLEFKESLDNVGDSFNYFTTDYKNNFLAYYKGKSTEEVGAQFCELAVKNKLPSFGEFLDKISEPEDPPQYTAFFSSSPYIEDTGEFRDVYQTPANTKELWEYDVIYHIYAGTGFAEEQGVFFNEGGFGHNEQSVVNYMVYLQGPGLPPLYVTTSGGFTSSTDKLERGESKTHNTRTVGAAGYNEVCFVVNNKRNCGFGKVSSSFAVDQLNNLMTAEDAKTNVTSAEECAPEAPSYSLALGALPGVGRTTPTQVGALSTGIVRVCNPQNPTGDPHRWVSVGVCGKDPQTGLDRGKCWMDKTSVSISDLQLKNEVDYENYVRSGAIDEKVPADSMIASEEGKKILNVLNKDRDRIIEEIYALTKQASVNSDQWLAIQKVLWEIYKVKAPPITSGATGGGTGGNLDALLNSEAKRLGIEFAMAKAITAVEAGGKYFGSDGRLIIRMEAHVFNGEYFGSSKKMTKNSAAGSWGSSIRSGRKINGVSCGNSQSNEYDCLKAAIKIDETAAYQSISMGAPQIMGFNHKATGYTDAKTMFNSFKLSADNQIYGMFKFIENHAKILKAAQTKDFNSFGRNYNGDRTGSYGRKLEAAYKAAKKKYPSGFVATTGKKILIIGDSHAAGSFGSKLKAALEGKGYVVEKQAVGGTSVNSWITGKHGSTPIGKAADHIKRVNPYLVIFELGTNDVNNAVNGIAGKFNENYRLEGKAITRSVTDKCVYLGAPGVNEATITSAVRNRKLTNSDMRAYNSEAEKGVKDKCLFIDSMTLVNAMTAGKTGSDGIHFTTSGASDWVNGAITEMGSAGLI
jgi:hypothetical protein